MKINPKSKYRNWGPARRVGTPQEKSETNSNFQNPNDKNLQLRGPRLHCLEHWSIRISDLFRASCFVFRI
jgi:hypothetical protein